MTCCDSLFDSYVVLDPSILKCLWSKNFELQKCGHTEKSNYGLNLSIILMFLTIYGEENRSLTAATLASTLKKTGLDLPTLSRRLFASQLVNY